MNNGGKEKRETGVKRISGTRSMFSRSKEKKKKKEKKRKKKEIGKEKKEE